MPGACQAHRTPYKLGTTEFLFPHFHSCKGHYPPRRTEAASLSILLDTFKLEQFLHSCQRCRCLPTCHSPILPQHCLARMEEEARQDSLHQASTPFQSLLGCTEHSTCSCPKEGQGPPHPFQCSQSSPHRGSHIHRGKHYLSALSTAAFREEQEKTSKLALAVFAGVLKVTCKGKNQKWVHAPFASQQCMMTCEGCSKSQEGFSKSFSL